LKKLSLLVCVLALPVLVSGCVVGQKTKPAPDASSDMYSLLIPPVIETFIANARDIGRVQAELMSGEPADNPRAQALNKKTGWTTDQTRAVALALTSAIELQPNPQLAAIYNLPPLSPERKAVLDRHQPALDRAVATYKEGMSETFQQREKAGKKVPYRPSQAQSGSSPKRP